MTFREEVEATPGLAGAWRRGLQALGAYPKRVSPRPVKNVAGSADIDGSLGHLKQHQNATRWDYVVAWRSAILPEFLHWIEIHPASSFGNLREVKRKHAWLRRWLATDGRRLVRRNDKVRFVWIASGRSAFSTRSPEIKRLAMKDGIYFTGRRYTMTDLNS